MQVTGHFSALKQKIITFPLMLCVMVSKTVRMEKMRPTSSVKVSVEVLQLTSHCVKPSVFTLSTVLCTDKCVMPYYGGCPYSRKCYSSHTGASCGGCLPGFTQSLGRCVGISLKTFPHTWNKIYFHSQK